MRPRATIIALAGAVLLGAAWQNSAASPQGFIDLASEEPASHIIGVQVTDKMGQSLAAGDFNGDGIPDILVSADEADGPNNGRAGAGEAYVVLGSQTLAGVIDLASGGAALIILGANNNDHLGTPLATGDFNGDGFADAVVASRFGDGPAGNRSDAGEVYLIFGSESMGGVIDTASAQQDVTIYGADPSDALAASIAVGDVNGDGIDDLLLGTWDGDGPANSRSRAGDAYVIFGSPTLDGVIDVASGGADVAIYGAEAGDRVGYALASGDFNDDGTDDILVTAQWADGPGNVRPLAGEAYVIFGSPLLAGVIDIATSQQDFTIYGVDPQDEIGSAAAGDLNGDGVDDVLVVASLGDGALNGRATAGDGYAVFGPLEHGGVVDVALAEQDLTIYGADADDKLAQEAYALALGDFDGDGAADILAGSTAADGPANSRKLAGESYVIFGRPTLGGTIDLASSQGGVTIYGGNNGDKLGSAAAGDVNGDGVDEILVAALYARGLGEARPGCGEAYVITLGDTDGDGLLDIADPCPSDTDCDDDQYNDYVEMYLGTDALDACPDNPTDDAWPPDIDMDTWADVGDILMFEPVIMTTVPPSSPRYDFDMDHFIDVGDVLMYKPVVMTQCGP